MPLQQWSHFNILLINLKILSISNRFSSAASTHKTKVWNLMLKSHTSEWRGIPRIALWQGMGLSSPGGTTAKFDSFCSWGISTEHKERSQGLLFIHNNDNKDNDPKAQSRNNTLLFNKSLLNAENIVISFLPPAPCISHILFRIAVLDWCHLYISVQFQLSSKYNLRKIMRKIYHGQPRTARSHAACPIWCKMWKKNKANFYYMLLDIFG